VKNYSKERTGHGFNTNLQVTVGREKTPGGARGVPSFKAALWSQRGASHAVSTHRADCFPLTNGTRVADKSRAPESDCTAGAGNLRIWWVAFSRQTIGYLRLRLRLTLLLPPKLLWLFQLPCCTGFDSCQNRPPPARLPLSFVTSHTHRGKGDCARALWNGREIDAGA
jgi:hypothetical protein